MMSIYSGVGRIYTPRHSVHLRDPCISEHLPSLLEDVLGGHDRACLEMHMEAGIERVWRCTWRPRSSELSDSLGVADRASLKMHLEVVLATVPFSDRFYYSGSKKTRTKPVRSGFVPNGSFN